MSLALLAVVVNGGGCGGGGGGGGPAAGLPTRVALNQSNAVAAGNRLFVLTDNAFQQILVLTEGAQLAHSNGLAPLVLSCGGAGGQIEVTTTDADANGQLSAGDRVRVSYQGCDGTTGNLDLRIDRVTLDATVVSSFEGQTTLSLELTSSQGPIALRGSSAAIFQATPNDLTWRATGVSFSAALGGQSEALSGARIEKLLASDSAYRLDLSGTIDSDSLGGTFTIVTSPLLTGIEAQWPSVGQVTATGANNSRVAYQAQFGSSFMDYLVDANGDGQFDGGANTIAWTEVTSGVMFGVFDGGGDPNPDPADLFGRRISLGANAHDLAVDTVRGRIYVSLPDRNEIAVLSSTTLTVIERIVVGPRPNGLSLSLDGNDLHVALNAAGSIAVVDLDTFAVSEIEVASGLQHSNAFDLAETAPGVIFASPNTDNFAHVARLDRNAADAVSTVADNRIIRSRVELLADPERGFVYLGEGFSPNSLYKLDASVPLAPIILEDVHATIDGTDRMSLSPDGSRIYLRSGQVVRTADFAVTGNISRGIPWALSNGADVVVADDAGTLHIHSASSLALVDTLTTDCQLTGPSRLAPSSIDQQWLLLGGAVLCAVDLAHPLQRPGTGGSGVPATPPPTTRVRVVDVALGADAFDAEFDQSRNQVYVSLPSTGELLTVSAANQSITDRRILGNAPRGMDLRPDEAMLAVMFNANGNIGFLDLVSGQLQTADLAALLEAPQAHDVAYLSDDSVFATSDPSSGGFAKVVRTDRNDPAAARVVASNRIIRARPELAVSPLGDFLYVGEGFSPESLYKLDLGQPDAPIVLEDQHGQISGTDRLSVSPDGSRIALTTGMVLRTQNLYQAGQITAGVPRFSNDGSRVLVGADAGRIWVHDSSTFVAQRIVEGNCSISRPHRLVSNSDESILLTLGLSRMCFWFPNEPAVRSTAMQGHSAYACGTACVVRRSLGKSLQPRFSRVH